MIRNDSLPDYQRSIAGPMIRNDSTVGSSVGGNSAGGISRGEISRGGISLGGISRGARSSLHAPSVLGVGYSFRQAALCVLLGTAVAVPLVLKGVIQVNAAVLVVSMSYAGGCGLSSFLAAPKQGLSSVKYLISNRTAQPLAASLSNALSGSDTILQFWQRSKIGICFILLFKLLLNMYAFANDLVHISQALNKSQGSLADIVVIVEASMFSKLAFCFFGCMLSPISSLPGCPLSCTWFRALYDVFSWRQIPLASLIRYIKTLSGFSSLTFLRQMNVGQARNSFFRYWTRASRRGLWRGILAMLVMVILYLFSIIFGILALVTKIQLLHAESFSSIVVEPLNPSGMPALLTLSNLRLLAFANQVAALVSTDEFEIYSILLFLFAEGGDSASDETFAIMDSFMESYYDAFMREPSNYFLLYGNKWWTSLMFQRLVVIASLGPVDLRQFCKIPRSLDRNLSGGLGDGLAGGMSSGFLNVVFRV
eukprot:TRINITY_DN25084_c0_g1_i2.p1 TRINITY_DN25084_c0_g1~~TRINITY_DN25084_c0_g1_i2.p1  ORF type:complete len:481 (+),score=20.69 TRINITY_DN25084_c0_g1_i2:65-1507(+)